jgi:ABC-2 type transport system ATP-binding protein
LSRQCGLRDASPGYLLAERLDLRLDRRIQGLSNGNKQKVGLVQALMHEAELLVLDEPTSGLDPLVQVQFQQIVHEAAVAGRTVFLSSHVLDEVQDLAHRAAIVRAGKLVTVQDVAALRAQARRRVALRFAEPFDIADFTRIPGVDQVESDGSVLRCRVAGDVDT